MSAEKSIPSESEIDELQRTVDIMKKVVADPSITNILDFIKGNVWDFCSPKNGRTYKVTSDDNYLLLMNALKKQTIKMHLTGSHENDIKNCKTKLLQN